MSLNARHRNFGQVRTRQAWAQRQLLPPADPLSRGSRGGGGEKRRDLRRTRFPKRSCNGRELRVCGSRKRNGAGVGRVEATGKQ